MIAVQRPETFFASSPPHPRPHVVLRTRPFHPRPRLRPRPAALLEQRNTQRPTFAPRAVLQALKSLRPRLTRPRPAWALLPAPETQATHETTDPHEDEESEAEAEVEALLAFAEGLDVDGLEDDMEVVASSSSSPLPFLPSPPATPPPQAPLRPSPPATGRVYQNLISEQVIFKSEIRSPVLQARVLVPSPPPPAPAVPPPSNASVGPIHSARSVTALMERRALAVIAAAEDKRDQKEKKREEPLSSSHLSPALRRRRGGGLAGVAAVEDQKEAAASAGRETEGEGGGGGRPLEMPKVVIIDEEGGMRRQRRLAELPYWHENPAL